MTHIIRNPAAAAASYDLIVIGGGIYGAALTLEAARRGLRPLLLERDDFGAATSWNSLRIVHGGLRYLQTMDLWRFRESVRERRRFLRDFPDLVRPLPCLMPLYGDGLRRPSILRAALAVNDLFSCRRNAGVRSDRRLPGGRVLDIDATRGMFPGVRLQNLRGAALWHDAVIPASQRVLVEMLRWAASCGATCLNYVEAESLVIRNRRVAAVQARDRESGVACEFTAPAVVNCAGPWCAELAARFDRPRDELFRPSLAFNLLLDRDPIAEAAVAVAPPRPGARTCFVLPWHGRVLAGTFHAACPPGDRPGPPADSQIDNFLNELNEAVPSLAASRGDVRWVFWGLLPAAAAATDDLATREMIIDHAQTGGPSGLFSVSGVKFTTARLVGEKTLARIYVLSGRTLRVANDAARPAERGETDVRALLGASSETGSQRGSNGAETAAERLRAWAAEEAVVHLDDLLLRRADWQADPTAAGAVAGLVCGALGWNAERTTVELTRLRNLGIPCAMDKTNSIAPACEQRIEGDSARRSMAVKTTHE